MRLVVFSDCQFDTHPENYGALELPDGDVAVIAGDFFPNLERSLVYLERLSKQMPVVYVAGNRDFYGVDRVVAIDAARAVKSPDLHFLEDNSVVIDGVRFVGSTLWSNVGVANTQETASIRGGLNDFRAIRNDGKPWSIESYIAAHQHSVGRIKSELTRSVEPVVVVTHHAPHKNSVAPHRQDDPMSLAFYSDLAPLMEGPEAIELEATANLWVHGATHHPVDYLVGRTRVVSNPMGYRHENIPFQPRVLQI